MQIVVFGATGQIGRRVVREARARGHEVIRVVRDPKKHPADERVGLLKGDATDAASVAQLVVGTDAVVCAISPRPGSTGKAPSLGDAAHALIAGMRLAGVRRIIVVGGAGSLEVKPGVALMDAPGFPEVNRAEAQAQREFLAAWRDGADALDWTYFSPAAEIAPGERTTKFRLGEDALLADASGKSFVSMEDYAVALVDELERPRFKRKRMTIAY